MRQLVISCWERAFFSLISIPINLFVKSKPIPTSPQKELRIDLNQPILYVLPYNSTIDLLVLRQAAKQCHLPDPLLSVTINNTLHPSFIFIDKRPGKSITGRQKNHTLAVLKDVLTEYESNTQLAIQMLPVTVLFNRKPAKEGKKKTPSKVLSTVNKFFKIIVSGYDCYTRFSDPVLVKNLISSERDVEYLALKLARVARIHFANQHLATVGPKRPNHRAMLNQLLNSPTLIEAIHEEAKSKNISLEKARDTALTMLNEISAKFTYWMLRVTNFLFTKASRHLYRGLKIHNAESVRELTRNRHEIVYAPCHRSHMDYLLLSYVLYQQGLVPPHIAAGINLNFWPAGPIFRRLGAFFIRRSFKANKLYTTVFREYLAQLFLRGNPVEYFIEGGRSRTGRLLDPKTGMLMMTIQTMLRSNSRPITIVPIYIGYEQVLEVSTYANELRGADKQKESLWQTAKAFCKLKNLGYGYVNFGKPIPINQFLNHHVPKWRDAIDSVELQRPSWLTPTTNQLAIEIMQNINRSAAVNAMNLCCTILLNSKQTTLTKSELLKQMDFLLALLRQAPYDKLVTLPHQKVTSLFKHAWEIGRLSIEGSGKYKIVSLSQEQAVLMTYYRNNIQHLFIIPALIARIVLTEHNISRTDLIDQIKHFYPLIKDELFLYFSLDELDMYIDNLLNALIKLGSIKESNRQLSVLSETIINLRTLAASSDDCLQRYAIAFTLLKKNPSISRAELERQSRVIAEQIAILYGINAPEFFSKSVFSSLINTLREQGFFQDENEETTGKIRALYDRLIPLAAQDVIQTINEMSN